MPPVSAKQQRFIFAKANQGVPWAKKFVADAPTMKVALKKRLNG